MRRTSLIATLTIAALAAAKAGEAGGPRSAPGELDPIGPTCDTCALDTGTLRTGSGPQVFRPYTTTAALQLTGTMIVNPRRLDTIEVVGAFPLARAVGAIGLASLEAALDAGDAKLAERTEAGDFIAHASLDVGALDERRDVYVLARTRDVVPLEPDFRAIDWSAPPARRSDR